MRGEGVEGGQIGHGGVEVETEQVTVEVEEGDRKLSREEERGWKYIENEN